jgi:hypothetical protein
VAVKGAVDRRWRGAVGLPLHNAAVALCSTSAVPRLQHSTTSTLNLIKIRGFEILNKPYFLLNHSRKINLILNIKYFICWYCELHAAIGEVRTARAGQHFKQAVRQIRSKSQGNQNGYQILKGWYTGFCLNFRLSVVFFKFQPNWFFVRWKVLVIVVWGGLYNLRNENREFRNGIYGFFSVFIYFKRFAEFKNRELTANCHLGMKKKEIKTKIPHKLKDGISKQKKRWNKKRLIFYLYYRKTWQSFSCKKRKKRVKIWFLVCHEKLM